ncbi:cupredoxin domain-containing protein [Isoptericola sp. AK164]|uniref:cupredoxin domain-containing protein n=1 Tax=Isoptericola sp. AK164 TaxID=3024246 RepID=UPI0024186033|nr:cupredoxin domain-containing protein [Isoptericola sp. AK164]
MSTRPRPHAAGSPARPASSTRRALGRLVLPAVLLGLSACAGGPGPSAAGPSAATATPGPTGPAAADDAGASAQAAADVQVSITDTSFSVGAETIAAGESVLVTNDGRLEHSWTSEEAGVDTGVLGPGESVTVTAGATGTFTFSCTVHPLMTGTVTVS